MDESPAKEGLIWAGTDDGKVWVTKDGGAVWDFLLPLLFIYDLIAQGVNGVRNKQHKMFSYTIKNILTY